MGGHEGRLRSVLAWLVFPLVPGLLGSMYHQMVNSAFRDGPDPRDWGWLDWVLLTGPLVGYGFLAGVTLDLPDEPGRRGLRALLARRALWVAVGPWIGFLFWIAIFHLMAGAAHMTEWAYPASREWTFPFLIHWHETWPGWLLGWTLLVGFTASFAYGWLLVAVLALRRARRLGRCRRALGRGLTAALGFVGSLFGTFWSLTEVMRAYFFDPRVVPVLLAAATLTLIAGCGNTLTYGEVRRRELFRALFMAWLIGLALVWRWWRPPRSRPPGPD